MNSKRTKQKEAKKQQKLNEVSAPIAVGDTIVLREAALALNKKVPLKGQSLDVRRILDGLQEGLLTSGFFVNNDFMIWVAIPRTYWLPVTTKQFKVIRSSKRSDSAYLVSPAQFSDAYARARVKIDTRIHPLDEAWATSALKEALVLADQEFEVRLLRNAAWDEYQEQMLNRAIADATLVSAKSDKGRKEMSGWKNFYRTLAAHLIAYNITSIRQVPVIKDLAIATAKQALAESEGHLDLPGEKAMSDEIVDLFNLIERQKK